GSFGLDFEYVAGSGDLDAFGGRSGVTPEFPKGTYYYVMTEEYPFIPRKFKGTPDPSFSKQAMDPHSNLGGQGGPGAKGGKNGKKGPPPEGAPK
ncbi:MAG: YHYH protein, partial [Verrucomicrobia bacterium]|nr:YHYH protein [Verrucomicrobiota bacterium]